MLSQDHFYWNMTKKYVIAFGHIFSDLHVLRTNSSGETVKDITVPITYAGKRKFFQIMQRNEALGKKISAVLPRLSFLITGIEPDPTRRTNPTITIPVSTDGTTEDFIYNPVPYNFTVDVAIWAKNMDDLLQIVEQAVIFFNPYYTMTVKEIDSLDISRNITVIMNSVDFEIETDLDETSDRTLIANMNFTLKGFLYPPIKDSVVIKYLNTRITSDEEFTNAYVHIHQEFNELTDSWEENKRYSPEQSTEFDTWLVTDDIEAETGADEIDLE